VVRTFEALSPLDVSILSERRRDAPFGLAGGDTGRPGRNSVRRRGGAASEQLAAAVDVAVEPGDEIQIETPGGGGFGVEDR
jgi:N-methylhydantoinase B/oxoprolinase/acetone carboxylase alpha subunit